MSWMSKIRPQVAIAMTVLGIGAVMLIDAGATEGATGVLGMVAGLGTKLVEGD